MQSLREALSLSETKSTDDSHPSFAVDIKSEAKENKSNLFVIEGLNVGMLPSLTLRGKVLIQINRKILEPNMTRAEWITDYYKNLNTNPDIKREDIPDVICLQEAFDGTCRKHLDKELTPYYPFHSGKLGEKFLNAGSGLKVYSKHPIVDQHFEAFKARTISSELFANKGFIALKLRINEKQFITVYCTHLHGGLGLFSKLYEKYGITSSKVRNEQMAQMRTHFGDWATKPVVDEHKQTLRHMKTFFEGDINISIDDKRRTRSISLGMSNNGFKKGDVKYPGVANMFHQLKYTRPSNWIRTRTLEPLEKGKGKRSLPLLVLVAKLRDKKTGTSLSGDYLEKHMRNKTKYPVTPQTTEGKIIDALMSKKGGALGTFTTNIITPPTDKQGHITHVMSDHFALRGVWRGIGQNLKTEEKGVQVTAELSDSRSLSL